jgi:hypothetical protein
MLFYREAYIKILLFTLVAYRAIQSSPSPYQVRHLVSSKKYTKSGKEVLMSTVNELYYCILSTQQFAPRLLHHGFLTFKLCKRMFYNLFEIYSCGMLFLSEKLHAEMSQ